MASAPPQSLALPLLRDHWTTTPLSNARSSAKYKRSPDESCPALRDVILCSRATFAKAARARWQHGSASRPQPGVLRVHGIAQDHHQIWLHGTRVFRRSSTLYRGSSRTSTKTKKTLTYGFVLQLHDSAMPAESQQSCLARLCQGASPQPCARICGARLPCPGALCSCKGCCPAHITMRAALQNSGARK